jgi:hypothetical protein
MKKTFLILSILLVFAAVVWAAFPSVRPDGIATPKWYGYSSGAVSTYYLEHPTLTANDQVVVEGVAQTLTNKTLTAPAITTPTITTAVAPVGVGSAGAAAYAPGGATTSAADSLAIPITTSHVAKTTGADAEALTLANGTAGQILTIDLAVDGGGDGTLTPTTKSGFTSIVFADAGDNATLLYVDNTVGWVILGTAGVAAPPVTVD